MRSVESVRVELPTLVSADVEQKKISQYECASDSAYSGEQFLVSDAIVFIMEAGMRT